MSAVKIIRALLAADTIVSALVPSSRIIAGVLPQGVVLPAVAVTEVSRVDRDSLKPGSFAHSTSRVQVTVIAASYPVQKQLLEAVRHACRDKLGVLDSTVVGDWQTYFLHIGISGVSVLLAGTGPDFNDSVTGFYMQSQDFKVSFTEAT